MTDEYIRKEDVLKEKRTGRFPNGICMEAKACVTVEYIKSIQPADVISKADMLTLLEETEKDITKGVEASPIGMMIKSVFGVIKCKVNMMGEKTDG